MLAITLIQSDLEFILQQTEIAEAHAAGADLNALIANTELAFGLRTVDGSFNNLISGRSEFGASDNTFPRLLDPNFRTAESGTSYNQTSGTVIDSQPRTISNLIVDQTATNPAAVATAAAVPGSALVNGTRADGTPFQTFFIPNVSPDEGLSAPFNSWMTFFGQFFDHGLDLVNKGGNGTVFMPLKPDDPLFVPGSPTNFMVLTRATMLPGPDGVLGTADDIHENTNQTTPFVDQNQTYTSHPSHQVFLREYELDAAGKPVATGKLLVNRNLGADGQFGTADDVVLGGMSTWAVVKAQARALLGINLTDADVANVPLLATDPYGRFLRGANGFAQLVTQTGLVEGNPAANGGNGVAIPANVIRTGHAFLDDIAHIAAPRNSAGVLLTPDADAVAGVDDLNPNTYDNELLDAHYIAGDGRVNENIGLTAVHHIFHSEHNRLVDYVKDVILQSGDVAFLNKWLIDPVAAIPANPATLVWNGERLFQAAKFGTEMQYQHLVFEEFARTIQPNIDVFLDFDDTINPAIVAEFAHTVYRFGHSMLTETIDRLDPNFGSTEIGLIQAFLNPLAFAASGPTPEEAAGAIIRGVTRQQGNAIDEFVTEALRNNLVGLPLDLPAINMARARDTGIPSLNAARRQFFEMTGDTQLTPYTSWADFAPHLKHAESLINFVAAYGTHTSITGATTLAAKRDAAALLVLGGAGAPADRLDFLNGTGAWASLPSGVTVTGLDNVDFWVGGLAEQIMPFGGMLGPTFNFVFETQLENLQDGDRFYYLHRTVGTNFLTELENNSFSKLIAANTDVKHLPAIVFSLPGLTLEVDQATQFNAGLGNADPVGADPLVPLVIRDNPATAGADTNYLQYTGDEHVTLGGTDPGNPANPSGNDILIASIGDDTLWGGAGNDRLEGGFGNDTIEGGPGDDIITDMGGDDVLKGGEGNDVIHGGNGFNLIIGGPGKDFIVTGEDISETFAGPGDDFILGSRLDAFPVGNEGDDWIELGTQDGAAGDNFDPLGRDLVPGNDVFLGDGSFDEHLGEGGDDISVGSEGPDKYKLASGFDWVTFKDDRFGVVADMFRNAFNDAPLPASLAAVGARFAQVEGLSGSAFADVLRGDDADAAQIALAGAQGSILTNLDLIAGLRAFLGTAAAGPDGITGTADDQFGAGNIILGGDGSDIIEGRGGDDLIDGDRWLNVRISVRQNIDGTGPEIRSVNSMKELVPDMLSGAINPGQLVIVREILTATGPDFDTAVFSDVRANYLVTTVGGVTTVTHVNGPGGTPPTDGTDRLTNIERLQFADQTVVLVPGLNNEPVGQVAILDTANVPDLTPVVGQVLRASIAGVTDADNPGGGTITGPVGYTWQFEPIPGTGAFQDISFNLAPRGAPTAVEQTFTVTPDLLGSVLRVKAVYRDANGVLETVFSAATAAVAAGTPAPAPAPLLTAEQPGVTSPGVHFLGSDLQFILDQIKIAEQHAAGADLLTLIPNGRMALGLRTVDGSLNNLVQNQTEFGAADNTFPRMLDPNFRTAEGGTSYLQTSGTVIDSQPRTISNLIVDQTENNPAAVAAADAAGGFLVDGTRADGTPFQTFFIPNTAPDEGLSAGFNAWMTFFGQFFDHGLDLVNKGGNGTVFMPLQPDDPLFDAGADGIPNTADDGPNFMVLTRATMLPGPDGVLGTADDIHENVNQTTPFVDQNQTYTSHPSHQVFLRAYELNTAGRPVATGKLIVNRNLGADGQFGTADDVVGGGMATWAVVKAQARALLGINLTDADVTNLPLLATDPYGRFLPGANGFAQLVTQTGLVEGNPAANGGNGITIPANVIRTGHAFLDDIAHIAAPRNSAGVLLTPDADAVAGVDDLNPNTYDNELLDAHYIAGDGRVNENIGLTTVHHIFHSEHNRLVDHVKDVLLATAAGGDVSFLNEWLLAPVASVPANPATLVWNGERLFQAAKFGTEMQYQHLVFEEFARTVSPNIDPFIPNLQNYQTEIDPSIVAEFAHTVYRFGHSMLTETIDRLDPNFGSTEIGLIQAFLNPLAFAASGPTPEEAAGAIVRGVTRQLGNEIDEFVTEALRNNLVGLPLDLPAINMARARDTGIPSLNAARRQFHQMTGDSQLTPYTSWADFVQHLKHPESLVNFVAAYGTHTSITGATTLADKRDAAALLVLGGVGEPADRLDFLFGTGAWASLPNGVTTTGLDNVDFWVGGLAEQIMPFGGMLGSTFNFVFETQLEALQNGDRFYYLERTANLNFVAELENNSFAKMVMNNTDATHLPALIFLTPGLILEVDQSRQFNAGLGNADPAGDVIRDNPATPGADTNYLQYTGGEHVVLGGTDPGNPANPSGNDILIGSIGDDTIWGGAGNDRIEGGFGNDSIRGGPGDDIITDAGGDDNIQGDDGNDVIHGGNGLNLILGGFGKDFIVTGEDSSESFGGPGDDFILGSDNDEQNMGGEGDDWLEGGLLDGSPGDNFDPLGRDLIVGNDVYIGSGQPDIMNAEGGDDIMVGSAGPGDKYLGASGFDWATFKDEPSGVTIDMSIDALDAGPIPAAAGILARFAAVEGLSGSPFGDLLVGDNADAAVIAAAGMQGSVLRNFNLIAGLRAFVGAAGNGPDGIAGTADDQFGAGNIILGGDGSDIIRGDAGNIAVGGGGIGGDDLIDGDKWLNVRISVRQNLDGTGPEIATFDSMVPMVPLMLNGTYNPGQLVIVREILPGNGGFDTALYAGPLANYTVTVEDNGTPNDFSDDVVTVTDNVGFEGSDRLTNVERLQFADQAIVLVPNLNAEPVGLLTIGSATPSIGERLTASALGVSDADGLGPIGFVWQVERDPGTGIFEDILTPTGVGVARNLGPTFTVTPDLVGLVLRVQGFYTDGHGVLETVFSAPTNAVIANIAPAVTGFARTVAEDTLLTFTAANFTANFSDADGTALQSVRIVTLPPNGVLRLSGVPVTAGQVIPTANLGNLTYQGNANFFGADSFTWDGSDGVSFSGAPATVAITVTPVADPSIVTNFSKTVAEDTLLTFTAADFTSHFSDADGELLQSVRIVSLPANGVLRLSGTPVTAAQVIATADLGNLTFQPNANFNGAANFTWDGFNGTAFTGVPATVAITVTAVNDAPTVTGFSRTTAEDILLSFTAADFTANFSDVEGTALQSVQIVTLPANGTLRLSGTPVTAGQSIAAANLGNLTYLPGANFNGAVSFTWNGSDGALSAAVPATVSITVTAVNDAPTVTGFAKSVVTNTLLTFTVADFTGNYSDVEGTALQSVQIVSLPANGVLALSGTAVTAGQVIAAANLGNLTFQPAANFTGVVSFTWNGSDGSLFSGVSATVGITVTPPPFAASFDFGTAVSPLAAGHIRVTETTTFSAAQGYGWQSGAIGSRDRATGTDLERDFNFTPNGVFAVNLPNGLYQVNVTLGDRGAFVHDNMGVFLENVQVDTVSTASTQVVTRAYSVNVTDGQLTLRLQDFGGVDPNVTIVALAMSNLAPPTPSLFINDVAVTEGDAGTTNFTFTVSLSQASGQPVLVQYVTADGTATAGSDYTATSGTLTIPAGQTSGTIVVSVNGDTDVEPNETFFVNLSNPSGATIADNQGQGTILSEELPALTVSINPASVAENGGANAATGTVTRSGPTTSALTVNLSSNDTTEATVPATVTIAAGQASATFAVAAVDDAVFDGTQNVTVTASAAGLTSGTASVQVTDNELPALTVTINPASFVENAGASAATGTVTRQGPTTSALTVNLASNDTTEATVPATVTIAAGQSSATFAVAAVDDVLTDGTQTVVITASAAGFTSGTANVQVTDNEQPTLTVTINPASFAENAGAGAATGTVTRNGPTAAALTVNLASNDTTEATVPATVTIAAGQASATFAVAAVDDAVFDGTQNATVTASAAGFISGTASVQVTDNELPALTVTINPASFAENAGAGAATGTVTRQGPTTSAVTVNLSSNDTTEATVPATVTILAGQSSATFAVAAVDDAATDGTQTAVITASAAGYAAGAANVQVTDNDAPPFAASFDFGTAGSPLEAGYTRVTETTTFTAAQGYGWQSGTIGSRDRGTGTALTRDLNFTPNGVFGVNLPNGLYQVNVTLGDQGAFFHDNMGVFLENVQVDTVSTGNNQVVTRTYSVNVSDGQLNLRLQDLGGADPNVAIEALAISTLAPPTPSLSINDVSLTEGNAGTTNFTFTVSLSQASGQPVLVQYATADGTATAGSDYTATSGTLTIPAGQTSGTIVVSVNGDTDVEPNETFFVNLSNPSGATIADNQGQGTILSDELPTLTVSINPASVAENAGANAATGTVTRTGPTTAALTVNLVSNDTTEATVPATVTIPAGQVSATFAVAAVDDAVFDGTQNVTVTASAAGLTSGTASVAVTDNELPALTVAVNPASFAENAGAGAATGTVTRQGPTTSAVTVSLASGDTTEATVPATVTILAGQSSATFAVAAVDDATADGMQTVVITVSAAGYTSGTANVQVTDNDPPPFAAHFDFGTATSIVAAGYTRVTETTTFNAAQGYGWQSGVIGSRDRGTGTALDRDLNFTQNGVFAVNLPNGRYQVDAIFGDRGNFFHDNMGIFLEGAQVDTVSTGNAQVVNRSYVVDVIDGQLNLRLQDLGGADPNVTIEAMDIALLQLFG